MKTVLRAVAAVAVATTTLLVPVGQANAASSAAPSIAAPQLGDSAATAAASCWEIKQLRPDAPSGAYWLLTSKMAEPQQLFCDQTTDGGGWVLVAKGRDGYSEDYLGQNDESRLTEAGPGGQMTSTVQLSSRKVDQLLGGGRPDALSDGIRVRRARDTAGSQWQEVRLGVTSKKDRWSWTFGSQQPMTWFSFDGVRTNAGTTTANFGTDNAFNRVYVPEAQDRGYKIGFGYGSGVVGTTDASTYLWSARAGAPGIPFSEVYLRPKLTSFDSSFSNIPDAGTEAVTNPKTLRNAALTTPWGVADRPGSTSDEFSVEVQDFTQSGNTMFVGGNFRYVQRDANGGGRVEQPFLAGFDVNSGELVTSFRPNFNEQVRALATLPDGTVVAGGEFTQVNGQPVTAIVGLDPVTGATRSSFQLSLENRITGGALRVRSLDVAGDWLYIGGAVTHFTGGPQQTQSYMRNLGRVAFDGTPPTDWKPNPSGSVADSNGSADGSRVYAAGYFTTMGDGAPAPNAAAILSGGSGELATPAWTPTWSAAKSYQQAIVEAAGRVWVGGSEHSFFSFDTGTFARLSGNITKDHGDIQAETVSGDMIFAGCHCSEWNYENAFTWSGLNPDWTRVDNIEWFGQWDAKTGARVPDFTPRLNMRNGNGVWALETDSLGNVWAGGDITTVRTGSGNRFSGGFARFTPADSAAPSTPSNLRVTSETASTVSLSWGNATDAGGGVRYQILRDDRPIAFTTGNTRTITVPKGGNNRFFVRATDAAGNVGASSTVLSLDGVSTAPTADFAVTTKRATANVDASASAAANGSISAYGWAFGDGTAGEGVTTSHTYGSAGDKVIWLSVLDSQGGVDTVSKVVTVKAPALQAAPSDAFGALVFDQDPWAYYRLGDSGPTALDAGPEARNGTYVGTVSRNQPGALAGVDNPAIAPSVSQGGAVNSPRLTAAPGAFSIGVWFKTASTSGGRLIGYGSSSTNTISSSYDRKIQMLNDGKLMFGTYPGSEQRATTAASYNDNKWHYAVATQGSDGMKLYVDGAVVASNAATTAQNYLGSWRIGTDSVWSGSSSRTLAGTLDEAVIFDRVLLPAEIERQYQVGTGTAPANEAPTANFTTATDELSLDVDGTTSFDPDGSITSYAWEFGDGATATGARANHTFSAAGTYMVKLTVSDDRGATGLAEAEVTVEEPPATPVDQTVIQRGAEWRWRYAAGEPASDWTSPTYDASSWNTGAGVLGFGAPSVVTNIDSFTQTSQRPLAAYFIKSFNLPAGAEPTKLRLSSVADDGAVFYVNGTEVARQNMPAGAVSAGTYASSARRHTVASSNPVEVDVPVSLLRIGVNVVTVETHVNYRGTPDLTFDLQADLSYLAGEAPPNQMPTASFAPTVDNRELTVDASGSSDPDGTVDNYAWEFGDGARATGITASHTYAAAGTYPVTLSVTDNRGGSSTSTVQVTVTNPPPGATQRTVIENGSAWRWRYESAAPPATWNQPSFDSSSWNLGNGVLGFGAPSVTTNIDTFAQTSQRPLAAYFTRTFDVPADTEVVKLTLDSVADDGAVFYVNGVEVARQNMPTGDISHGSYASSSRRHTVANSNPVQVDVPVSLLREGLNTVSVETHLNYRATPDLTFDLQATITY